MKTIIETSLEYRKVDPEGRYDLSVRDVNTLLAVARGGEPTDGTINALLFAYHAGLVRGAKAEKARRKKGSK